jgi:hypothetical protein
LSKRRITLSTSGVVPEIPRAGDEIGTMLAISLHATTDEIRDKLVPLNKKYPIADLLAACRQYPGLSNARRITFEYVMLKGVNDSLADAKRLVQLLKGIPAGIDLRSPSRHPDVLGADDLVIKVEEFREATGYRVPVSVKLGAGRVRDDIKIAWKDGFDFVELDGMQGSTGAAGNEVLEFVGIPTLSAIQEARDALTEVGGLDMPVILMGGIKDGIDTIKALALGAHAVAMGTSAIIAGGCIACLQCHAGTCVTGIATQDPEHEKRYNVPVEARNIHHFLESVRWQIAAITHAMGYSNPHQVGAIGQNPGKQQVAA